MLFAGTNLQRRNARVWPQSPTRQIPSLKKEKMEMDAPNNND